MDGIGDYPVEDDFAGCAWFSGHGQEPTLTISGSKEITDITSVIVVATTMTPERDEEARELASIADTESYDEAVKAIAALGYASCAEKLSDARITVTARFDNGTEQTKVYQVRFDGDIDAAMESWSYSIREMGQKPAFASFAVERVTGE